MRVRERLLAAIALAAMSSGASLEARGQGTGRVLAAIGICTDSVGDIPVIRLRKVDKSAHHNVVGPFLPTWDYTDETGRFKVFTTELPAGEWEFFNHSMLTKKGVERGCAPGVHARVRESRRGHRESAEGGRRRRAPGTGPGAP
jgi:hypothetical protein